MVRLWCLLCGYFVWRGKNAVGEGFLLSLQSTVQWTLFFLCVSFSLSLVSDRVLSGYLLNSGSGGSIRGTFNSKQVKLSNGISRVSKRQKKRRKREMTRFLLTNKSSSSCSVWFGAMDDERSPTAQLPRLRQPHVCP